MSGHVRDRAGRINLSALARVVGVSPQRLHGYWHGRFPWPADVLLRVMAAADVIRLIEHDGEDRLMIDIPLDRADAGKVMRLICEGRAIFRRDEQ